MEVVEEKVKTTKQKPSEPPYSQAAYEAFIRENLEKVDQPVARITYGRVSDSHWRVNIWGRNQEEECTVGNHRILLSKFVRIDLDEEGKMVYNDVTEGKLV